MLIYWLYMLGMNDVTYLWIFEAVISALTMTLGFSLFSRRGKKRLKRFSYSLLFLGTLVVLILAERLPASVDIAASVVMIALLYVALFRENFLNLVVVFLFALAPNYLMIPVAEQLLGMASVSIVMASLLAHGGIFILYIIAKVLILIINPSPIISPVMNISALIFTNLLVYISWYAAIEKSFITDVPINLFNYVLALVVSLMLNGLIIMNFIKTEATLESLKDFDEIKMTVSPLIESNIGLQEGFSKQLKALKRHIKQSDKQAKAYIDEIIVSIEEETEFSRWQKPVVGALMIRKKQEAAEKGISLETVTDGNEMQFPVEDYLLIPILTHLIDCALECMRSLGAVKKEMVLWISSAMQPSVRIVGGEYKKMQSTGIKRRLNNRCKGKMIELRRLVRETKGTVKIVVLSKGFEINIDYEGISEAAI